MLLQDEEQIRSEILTKLNSGQWWMIIAGQDQQHVLSAIEEHFYKGSANKDFHLILGWLPPKYPVVFGCAFAKKTRLPARVFAKFLNRTVEELQQRDILYFSTNESEFSMILSAFSKWIGDDVMPLQRSKYAQS